MSRERIVVDTNMLISALLSSASTPARALDKAIAHGQLLASDSTLRELVRKFESRKFDPYVPREQRSRLLEHLVPLVEIVAVTQQFRVSRDPDDDQFLELAVAGAADVVISGDRDLLALHPFRGIAILAPAAYLRRPTAAAGDTA